jgi:hypothetical protein
VTTSMNYMNHVEFHSKNPFLHLFFGFVSSLALDLEVLFFSLAESADQLLPSRRSDGPGLRFVCKVPSPHQVFLLPLKLQGWNFFLLFFDSA